MIFFEDEKEEKEKNNRLVKNILGEEKWIYDDYVKINVLKISSINDVTEEMKSILRRNFIDQMFEVTAVTESMDIVCDRKIIMSFDTFIKFMKNDYFYGEFEEGIENIEIREEFYKRRYAF